MAEKRDLLRWPSWVPIPQRSGYKFSTVDRRQKTDMEVGAVYRVQFDTDECACDCTLVLDNLQSAWFENFELQVLHQGAQWFQMPLQSGGAISMHSVRFKTRPTITEAWPTHSTYQFTLDVDKRPETVCRDILELITCVSPGDLCRASKESGTFWMSLAALQEPKEIYNEFCPWLDGVLWCIPDEELCGAAEALRETMQEVIPSIDLSIFENSQNVAAN